MLRFSEHRLAHSKSRLAFFAFAHSAFLFSHPSDPFTNHSTQVQTLQGKRLKMSPTGLDRFKKKPRLAKHSIAVLYVESNGCIHSCLPFFVDSRGGCHVSLDDDRPIGAQGSSSSPPHMPPPNSPAELSDEDMYIEIQLVEMRESEGHNAAMNCIFEEIVIRSRESSFLHSEMQEEEEHRRMMQPVFKQVLAAVAAREIRMEEKRMARGELHEYVLKDTAKATNDDKRATKNGKSAVGAKAVSSSTERGIAVGTITVVQENAKALSKTHLKFPRYIFNCLHFRYFFNASFAYLKYGIRDFVFLLIFREFHSRTLR